jgi:5-methylcytosine-specific restriction endonuclease McrA
MNYKEQLLSIEWKNKRLIILKRDNFSCVCCGSLNDLQVHHKKYIKGRMAWDYPNSILITVCGECHLFIHNTNVIKSEKETFKKQIKEKPKVAIKIKNLTKKQKRYRELYPKLFAYFQNRKI